MNQRLYKAEWVRDESDDEYDIYDEDYQGYELRPDPAGWAVFAIDRWGVDETRVDWPRGYQPFFFPSTDRIYRSRSAAQRRVDMINRWGGNAVLVECTPIWETVADANKRRAAARLQTRVEKKRAELAALEVQAVGA